jgi:hypothetical protein
MENPLLREFVPFVEQKCSKSVNKKRKKKGKKRKETCPIPLNPIHVDIIMLGGTTMFS